MTKTIFNRVFAVLLAAIMCIGMVAMTPMVAYAAEYEDDGTWISDYDTYINRGQNDRKLVIEVKCPEALRSTVIALMENNETGQRYFARLEAVNKYQCSIWLPMGEYTMLDIYCPSHEKFEFVVDTTAFTIQTSNNGTITYTMKDLDKWVADEYGNLTYDENAGNNDNQGTQDNQGGNTANPGTNDNSGNQNPGNQNQGTTTPDKEITREEFIAEVDKNLFTTPFDFIKIDDKGNLYYNTSYTGTSKAYMRVYGFSAKECDGLVKITKSGILGEAIFQISIDGGKTFLPGSYVATKSTVIDELDLTINFEVPKDTDELYEGDVYTFKTIVTYSVKSNVSPAYAIMLVVGNPTVSQKFKVEVMSSGGFGVAKVGIYDANLSDPQPSDKTVYVIPENGILQLDDNIQLVFKDLDTYAKDQLFIVDVSVPDNGEIDYTNLIILAIVVFFIGCVGFVILMNKKEKAADYKINEYKGFQDESKYK